MNKSFLALAFALSLIPVAGLAQDANAPAQPSDAQRQAMHQTFEQFGQAESRLHDQLRLQILTSLTPIHRRAIAAEIGNLVISPNPDINATAQRIDALLSPGERSRIMQAHTAFAAQSRALHQQMMTAMQSQMPAGHPAMHDMNRMQSKPFDAGMVVLRSLPPHPEGMTGMMHHMMDMGGHMEGPPPPR
jgi:hypothetical protein